MKLFFKKNKPLFALLFRILGLLVGITAITLQLFTNSIVGKGFMANHVLAYFTVQTNILSTLIFLYLIVKTVVISIKAKELQIAHMYQSLHLACTFYITITMTVFWAVLFPMLGIPNDPLQIANNIFLHTLTPLCAIIDCVFFFKHGVLKKLDAVKWLSYPVLYLISVVIIANVSDVPYYQFPMGGENIPLMYPYPFLDPQVVTIGGSIGIMIGLLVIVYLFGLLYIFVDNKIAKHEEKQVEEEAISAK